MSKKVCSQQEMIPDQENNTAESLSHLHTRHSGCKNKYHRLLSGILKHSSCLNPASCNAESGIRSLSHVSVKHKWKMNESLCFSTPVAEVCPVCCSANARWREISPETLYKPHANEVTPVPWPVYLSYHASPLGQSREWLWLYQCFFFVDFVVAACHGIRNRVVKKKLLFFLLIR